MEPRVAPGLLQNLISVNNLFGKILNTVFKTYPVPLSVPEYVMLWTIHDNPGNTQYQLSKMSGFTTQRCHQIIQSLLDSELVEKAHIGYGNKTNIVVTPKGTETAYDIQKLVQGIMTEGLSEEELQFFEDVRIHLERFGDLWKASENISRFLKQ